MNQNTTATLSYIVLIVFLKQINILPTITKSVPMQLGTLFLINYIIIAKTNVSNEEKLKVSLMYSLVGFFVLYLVQKFMKETFENGISEMVMVYSTPNYGGTGVGAPEGEHPFKGPIMNQIGQDSMQSIRIPEGKLVVLFRDEINQGPYILLTSSVPDLNKMSDSNNPNMNWAKNVSSMIIRSTDQMLLFTKPNFQGVPIQVTAPGRYALNSPLMQQIGSDSLASIIVPKTGQITINQNDLDNPGHTLNIPYPGINDLSKINDIVDTGFRWNNNMSSFVVGATGSAPDSIPVKVPIDQPPKTIGLIAPLRPTVVYPPYDNGKIYNVGDIVLLDGILYIMIDGIGAPGYPPPRPTNWKPIDPSEIKTLPNKVPVDDSSSVNYTCPPDWAQKPTDKNNGTCTTVCNKFSYGPNFGGYPINRRNAADYCIDMKNGTDRSRDFDERVPTWPPRDTRYGKNLLAKFRCKDPNGNDTTVSLGVGVYDIDPMKAAGIMNDSVSAVEVPNGLKVTLFADGSFQGDSLILTDNSISLDKLQGRVSSIIITGDTNCTLQGQDNVAGDKLYSQFDCENIIGGKWHSSIDAPGYGECTYKIVGGSHSWDCRDRVVKTINTGSTVLSAGPSPVAVTVPVTVIPSIPTGDPTCKVAGKYNAANMLLYTKSDCENVIGGVWDAASNMPGYGECTYKTGGSHSYECRKQ